MHVEAAVARKLEAGASAAYEDVKRSALSAIERISQAGFGAVVFDLDGTLVGSGPRREIAAQLARLSEDGIRLAIVTGRAASETTRNLWSDRMSRNRPPAKRCGCSASVERVASNGPLNKKVKARFHNATLVALGYRTIAL